MSIVLQHKTTGLYFRSPGVWTGRAPEAFDFGSSQKAIEFIARHEWTGLRILAVFINDACVDTIAFQMPQGVGESIQAEAA